MNPTTAHRFEKLCAAAHDQGVSYDVDAQELTIVDETFTGSEAIAHRLASTEWDMTDEQIENAPDKAWGEDVWWYALHLAAKQAVEASRVAA